MIEIDPKRLNLCSTGIPIRAWNPEKQIFGSYDIGDLSKESLKDWLTSREGENRFAEDVVGILLGHGHLHE